MEVVCHWQSSTSLDRATKRGADVEMIRQELSTGATPPARHVSGWSRKNRCNPLRFGEGPVSGMMYIVRQLEALLDISISRLWH